MKSIFENRLSRHSDSYGQLSDRQREIIEENRFWDGVKAFGRGAKDATVNAATRIRDGIDNARYGATRWNEDRKVHRDAERTAREDLKFDADMRRYATHRAAMARRQQVYSTAATDPAAFVSGDYSKRTMQTDNHLADKNAEGVRGVGQMYANKRAADEKVNNAYGDAAVETATALNGGKAPSKKVEKELRSGAGADAFADEANQIVTPGGNGNQPSPSSGGGQPPPKNPQPGGGLMTTSDQYFARQAGARAYHNNGGNYAGGDNVEITTQQMDMLAQYLRDNPNVWNELNAKIQNG